MDSYGLYTYDFCPISSVQGNLFGSKDVKLDMSTKDKNLWLDHLFGGRNTEVRIQHMRKNGEGADKYPCKVLAHGGRVVWLRLENEKMRSLWVKRKSASSSEPETISKEDVAENPYSHIFLDCREGKNLIAIMKENDAWRNTDVAARLLQESLNMWMQDLGYGFGIVIHPVTVSKDFWDYNRHLILKEKRKVKKMTIYFGAGSMDPQVLEYIQQIPILKRLLKEMWNAKSGKLELNDPLGSSIVDERKRDFRNIINLIGSNLTSDTFGVSLAYDNGEEIVCGKGVKLMYPMDADTFSMLYSTSIFGEYNINEWLDKAVDYIKEQKDGTAAETKRNRKPAKHVQDTSATIDLL